MAPMMPAAIPAMGFLPAAAPCPACPASMHATMPVLTPCPAGTATMPAPMQFALSHPMVASQCPGMCASMFPAVHPAMQAGAAFGHQTSLSSVPFGFAAPQGGAAYDRILDPAASIAEDGRMQSVVAQQRPTMVQAQHHVAAVWSSDGSGSSL